MRFSMSSLLMMIRFIVCVVVTGYWLLVTGYWLLVTGYWLLVTGYWLLATGYWQLATDARRSSFHEILELLPEFLDTQVGDPGQLREIVEVLEIRRRETEHVTPRDRVARRRDIDGATARAAGLLIDQVGERNRNEAAALHRHHDRAAA